MPLRFLLLVLILASGVSLSAQELIKNGGFESGATSWTGTTSKIVTTGTHYEGTRHAALLGTGKTLSENLTQSVTIPAAATKATLKFALQITTKETGTTVYDKLSAQVLNSTGTVLKTLATYSNANSGTSYVVRSFDLVEYKGQTVQIKFAASEDSSLATTFNVDAVSLVAETTVAGPVDLSIENVFVTQAIQKADRSVPLVADRRGLVRVFVKASASNTHKPTVKLTAYHGTVVAGEYTLQPNTSMTGVPTAPSETDYVNTYQMVLGKDLIKAGLRFVAQVDPTNAVAESNETNNQWDGTAENVKVLAPFKVNLVPLKMKTSGTTSVVSTSNAESYVEFLRRLHPVPESLDVKVHAPYTTLVQLSSSYDDTWQTILNEMDALRTAEGDLKRHYYGCINSHANGGTGMAFIGGFAGIGIEWTNALTEGTSNWRAGTFAHEVGHNLGRKHLPCGNPAGVDTAFPYSAADIGANGYDVWNAKAYNGNAGWTDVMAYCGYDWISDYGYKVSLNWRTTNDAAAGAMGVAAGDSEKKDCLLVWGRVEDGKVILEPAFRVKGVPDVEDPEGTFELEADHGAGTVRDRFSPQEVDHASTSKGFARLVAIPAALEVPQAPADGDGESVTSGVLRMRMKHRGGVVASRDGEDMRRASSTWTSKAGSQRVQAIRSGENLARVTWDSEAYPMAMIRDAQTGEVLSFARDGAVEVHAACKVLEVQLSNGVEQITRRIRIR